MKRPSYILVVLLAVFFATSIAGQSASPKETVAAFYKYDRSHSQIVNRRTVNARKQWLSDSLYNAFLRKIDETNAYLKEYPTDKPYFGDGFPFQPWEETCDAGRKKYNLAYSIGNASTRGNTAWVNVDFFYPKVCELPSTIYKLKLKKERGTWRIDDVIYEDGKSLVVDMKAHSYSRI